jgi:enolase
MQIGSEVYHTFKNVVEAKYGGTKHARPANIWDEGGLAAPFNDDEEAIGLLMEGIKKSGHQEKVKLSVQVSASNLFDKKDGRYDWGFKAKNLGGPFQSMNSGSSGSMRKSPGEMIKLFQKWLVKYPFVSIEDPFNHNDLATYELFTQQLGTEVQIVGADLFGTNPKRVQEAVKKKVCNAIAVIPSQVGSVSEAIEAAKVALSSGWSIVVSHRTGETEDSFIADLAVGVGAVQINAGAPCRSERLAKYNQLLRIEQELSTNAGYAGSQFPKGKFGQVEEEKRRQIEDTY